MVPNLRFQPPASDFCEICTSFKAKLLVAKQDIDEYNKVQAEYNEHKEAADLERQHYNNNIEESKNNLNITHICYDWAQNVSIPYSPQQVGSLYFKSTFFVHIFGVCKTSEQNHQLNFLIGENELPEGIKKVYRDNRVNIIDDIENIVNNSSKGNEAIQYNNKIGKVYASKKSGGEETSFYLLHNIKFDKNSNLNPLSTASLSNDCKKYLYTKIRQHVDDPYKDPQP
ncbi:chaperonin: PROVISIONAL [Gigaspora margarita]|uniref:Chaperonin: PROVISIONAL n=1 Tax=Gigaspora margarita TaxID=4874 RepID=A0A8H4AZ42_GIGMA|nr:chaperonin: PROVISIONAL [Gigaspora margarita]